MNKLPLSLSLALSLIVTTALPALAIDVPTVEQFVSMGESEQVALVKNLRTEALQKSGDYDAEAARVLFDYIIDNYYNLKNTDLLFNVALCLDEGLIVEHDYSTLRTITASIIAEGKFLDKLENNHDEMVLKAMTLYYDAGLYNIYSSNDEKAESVFLLNYLFTAHNYGEALNRLKLARTTLPDLINPVPDLLERYDSVKIATYYGEEHPDKGIYTVKKNNLYGMTDYRGNEIIPPVYASITYSGIDSINEPFIVTDASTGRKAMFNGEGKQLTPFDYKKLITYTDKNNQTDRTDIYVFATNADDRQGILNIFGEAIFPCCFDSISDYISYDDLRHHLIIAHSDGLSGVLNDSGRWIIPLDKQKIEICNDYNVISYIKNGKEGVISYDGEKGFKPKDFSTIFLLTDTRFGGKTPKGWVLVDIEGTRLNNEVYKTVFITGDNNLILAENNKHRWAAIDTLGNHITDYVFTGAEIKEEKGTDNIFIRNDFTIDGQRYYLTGNFNHGLAPVSLIKEHDETDEISGYGYVNTKGKIAIEPGYLSATEFNEDGEAIISRFVDEDDLNAVERKIVIDTEGKELRFIGLMGIEKINGKYGFYDFFCQEVLPPVYRNMETLYSYGFVALKVQDDRSGKWGLFDYFTHHQILPTSYDDISICKNSDFSYDIHFFTVKNNGMQAVTFEDGQLAIPFTDQHIARIETFNRELIGIVSDEEETVYGAIDASGNFLLPIEYKVILTGDTVFLLNKDDRWGMISKSGRTLIPFEYDSIDFASPATICLKKGKAQHLFDTNTGTPIISTGNNLKRIIRINHYGDYITAVQNKSGKWAFFDKGCKHLSKYAFELRFENSSEDDTAEDPDIVIGGKKYSPCSLFNDNCIALRRTEPQDSTTVNHIMVVNGSCKVIYEGHYNFFNNDNPDSTYVTVGRHDEYLILNRKGRVIKHTGYRYFATLAGDLTAVINDEGLFGFIDFYSNRLVVPCIYGTIGAATENEENEDEIIIPVAIAKNATRPEFYINADGEKVRDIPADSNEEFENFPLTNQE